jgi:hypothetical protein
MEKKEKELQAYITKQREEFDQKMEEMYKAYNIHNVQFSFEQCPIREKGIITRINFDSKTLGNAIKVSHRHSFVVNEETLLVSVRYEGGDKLLEVNVNSFTATTSCLTEETYKFGFLVRTHSYYNPEHMYVNKKGDIRELQGTAPSLIRYGPCPIYRKSINDLIQFVDVRNETTTTFFHDTQPRSEFMFRGRYYRIDTESVFSESSNDSNTLRVFDCLTDHEETFFDFLPLNTRIYTGYNCIYYIENKKLVIVK